MPKAVQNALLGEVEAVETVVGPVRVSIRTDPPGVSGADHDPDLRAFLTRVAAEVLTVSAGQPGFASAPDWTRRPDPDVLLAYRRRSGQVYTEPEERDPVEPEAARIVAPEHPEAPSAPKAHRAGRKSPRTRPRPKGPCARCRKSDWIEDGSGWRCPHCT